MNAMSKEGGKVVLLPTWTRCFLVVSILFQELKKHTHMYTTQHQAKCYAKTKWMYGLDS